MTDTAFPGDAWPADGDDSIHTEDDGPCGKGRTVVSATELSLLFFMVVSIVALATSASLLYIARRGKQSASVSAIGFGLIRWIAITDVLASLFYSILHSWMLLETPESVCNYPYFWNAGQTICLTAAIFFAVAAKGYSVVLGMKLRNVLRGTWPEGVVASPGNAPLLGEEGGCFSLKDAVSISAYNHTFCWTLAVLMTIPLMADNSQWHYLVGGLLEITQTAWLAGLLMVATYLSHLRSEQAHALPAHIVCNPENLLETRFSGEDVEAPAQLVGSPDSKKAVQRVESTRLFLTRMAFAGLVGNVPWLFKCITNFIVKGDVSASSASPSYWMDPIGPFAHFLCYYYYFYLPASTGGTKKKFQRTKMERKGQIHANDVKIRSLIGFGSATSVWSGSFGSDSCAVKILLRSHGLGKSFDKNIEDEVTLLLPVVHRNVVRVHGICRFESEGLGIVTDCCNRSLAAEIKTLLAAGKNFASDPLTNKNMLRNMLEISEGLAFLHSKKIIHADLRPQNIMLDERGVAKISDYGLARIVGQNEFSAFGRSPKNTFMAPELFINMFQGKRVQGDNLTQELDIFSLGTVFWCMVTFRSPGRGEKDEAVSPTPSFSDEFLQDGNRLPLAPDSCPLPLHKLINSCWENTPLLRPVVSRVVKILRDQIVPPEGDGERKSLRISLADLFTSKTETS
jgi:serine/threonine protein kinase